MNIFQSKQVFNLVVVAVQESKSEVPFNKTWQYLHDELGIGSVVNKKLNLTALDRQELSQLIKSETGVDATKIDVSALSELSRTEISKTVVNEKWSTRKVREDIVYLKSLNNEVVLDKIYPIPKGGYLAVPWQQAVEHQHKLIIAVENLEVFLNAEYVNWPPELLSSAPLVLYRGDAEATPSAFKKLIEGTTQNYYVFFDYDPAGFMMALTQPRQPSLIVPDESIEVLKAMSKNAAYAQQHRAVDYLKERLHETQNHTDALISHKLAVMQEKIMSSHVKLRVVNFS